MTSRGQKLVEMAKKLVIFSDDDSGSSSENIFSSGDETDIDKTYVPSSSDFQSSDEETADAADHEDEDPNIGDPPIPTSLNEENCESLWKDVVSTPLTFPEYPRSGSKINVQVSGDIDVLFCYKLFITDEVLDLIVRETNRYAEQQCRKQSGSKSRTRKWTPTYKEEILNFFSISITMGLVPLPYINLYWSKDPIFHNDFISSIMARDRYLLLLKFFHFNDNENEDLQNGRLNKIMPLLSLLLKNYQANLTPGRNIIIDESIIPFRGRLIFRQYIPNKAHKYGIKLYKLCTDNGYVSNVIIYCGKNSALQAPGTSHADLVVYELLKGIDNDPGRVLFADNYYSSIPLVRNLYNNNKMMYCGTLRSNRRGIPTTITGEKVKRGEIIGQQSSDDVMKIIKWQDKRTVMMLSTIPHHDLALVETGKTSRSGVAIKKPKIVIDYNKNKKGVDLSDQLGSYHTPLRRGLKWYRKLSFELLFGTSVINSLIIYNHFSDKKMSVTEFRRQLAMSLRNKPEEETTASPNLTISNKRVPHTLIKPEGDGRKKRRKCTGCYKNLRENMSSKEADKKVRKIITYCEDCEGQPGYCVPCFNQYHSKE